MSDRNPAIDGLRGLSAGAVMLGHALMSARPDLPREPVYAMAHAGVISFLLISGAVIPPALERAGNVPAFWVRRAYRLLPLYWLSIALWALISLLPWSRHLGTEVSPATWLINLTMLQGFVGVPDIQGVYWTLRLELVWYVLAAYLWSCGALRHGAAVLPVLALGALTLPGTYAVTALYLCCFALGMVATRTRSPLPLVAVLALCVAVTLRIPDPEGFEAALSGRLAGALVGWLVLTGRLPQLGRLARGGDVSYGVYLLHVPVIEAVPLVGSWLTIVGSGAVLVWCGLSIIAADLAWRFIEAPAIAAGRAAVGR